MATRRDNGEGTKIYQDANGRFWKKTGYTDPETGRRKRTTVRGASKAEVQEREKALKKAAADGIKPNAGKENLGDWLKLWIEAEKRNGVGVTSYNHYKNMAELYIYKSKLAQIALKSVKRADIQKYFNEMAEKYSPATLYLIRSILADCFNSAVADAILLKSPMVRISLPKIEKKIINPFTAKEIQELLSDVGNQNDMYSIILLGVTTGLRRGEICGLK